MILRNTFSRNVNKWYCLTIYFVVICLRLLVSPYSYNKTKTIYYIRVYLLPSLFHRLRTREECRRCGLYYSPTLHILNTSTVRVFHFALYPKVWALRTLWTVNGWFNTAGSVLQHGVLVWSLQSCVRHLYTRQKRVRPILLNTPTYVN